ASRSPRSASWTGSRRARAASPGSWPTTSRISRSVAWSGSRRGARGGVMRAELLALAALLAACGTAARLTRPEGDGGWSRERRGEEIARIADAAPPPPAPGPLTLADALALAERGNRRIAEAERTVGGARERVWQARGRLF